LLTRLWRNRKPAIAYYTHFHRPFPFDADSSWVRPVSFIDDLSESGIPALPRGRGSVEDFRHYMPGLSDARFAHIFGQQAAEYWLFKKGPKSDFVGCSTYRRYLAIDQACDYVNGLLIAKANPESMRGLGSDSQRDAALFYLQSADVITNRTTVLDMSIEQQYLNAQPAMYWHLFTQGIEELLPHYRPHMLWFRQYNVVSYETTYIMRRKFFMRYADEFFRVLDYVFRHASPVVPDEVQGVPHQHFRYPGFLGERFLPFFIYANSMRKIEVPLVHLDE
jgi:Domain of unknown function (DUF4422)